MSTLQTTQLELQRTLEEAYPAYDWSIGTVFNEQIIKPWAVNLYNRDIAVNSLVNNMSLVQVLNNPTADATAVDNLLSNFNVVRKSGSPSTGFMAVYFANASTISVPVRTTITCSGVSYNPTKTFIGVVGPITQQDTNEVSYIQARQISPDRYVFNIEVQSKTEVATILSPGQACTYDLSSNFISAIVTSSTFSGGILPETTAELIERAQLGITTSSNTGKDNIRALVEESPFNVLDSQVFGFGDEVQTRDAHNNAGISTGGRADVYVSTNPIIQKVTVPLTAERVEGVLWKAEIPANLYAGAYGVDKIYSGTSLIDTPIDHQIEFWTDNARPYIDNALEARYSKYQLLYVYFTDSTTLTTVNDTATYSFEILYMPNIDELQNYVEDESIQSAISDLLVKAFVPIEISIGVTVDYAAGVVPPSSISLATAVASAVNARRAGSSVFPASDVVYAIKSLFPSGDVRMPIALLGKIYQPTGGVSYGSDTDNISVPADMLGVSPGNTKFFSSPDIINITLNEV